MSINGEEYLYHYQKLKFKENNVDDFELASIRRKGLSQLYMNSLAVGSNLATCQILSDGLKSYSELVDKRGENDINNYAESSIAMASNCRNESQKWKSSLKDPEATLSKLLKPVNCDSASTEKPYICCSTVPSDSEVIKFVEDCYSNSDSEVTDDAGATFRTNLNLKKVDMSVHQLPTRTNNSYQAIIVPNQSVANNSASSCMQNFSTLKNTNNQKSCHKSNESYNVFDPWAESQNNSLFSNTRFPSPSVSSYAPNQAEVRSVESSSGSSFKTARQELEIQNQKKWGNKSRSPYEYCNNSYGSQKKSLGLGSRRGVTSKFVPPVRPNSNDDFGGHFGQRNSQDYEQPDGEVDERLKNIDPKMVELIRNEIMDIGNTVTWDDIAGLEYAKATIQEVVVWPILRPDIFTGLRRPPKGILLFGPPGTGKTLIGKCVASQSKSTFFSISASSLTSKWIGDGEKMVRALFAVARCHQPAVVFIDEIDSLLTQRSDTEHESSRRMKTEFLVQLDGAATGEEDRILVIGATNRPQELDEAARRRLVKKLYIPLPNSKARCQIVERLMSTERNALSREDIEEICTLTEGYSGADMKILCQEAALCPIRSIGIMQIQRITPDQVRPICLEDFKTALTRVRASVSSQDLDSYVSWDKKYGSGGVATNCT